MATAVRIFTHAGVVSVPITSQNLAASDGALVLLKQPYAGSDSLSCDTSTADASEVSAAPTSVKLALIEVETGKTVAYEVTPAGWDLRTATANSPRLTGSRVIEYGPQWRLSCLEVSS